MFFGLKVFSFHVPKQNFIVELVWSLIFIFLVHAHPWQWGTKGVKAVGICAERQCRRQEVWHLKDGQEALWDALCSECDRWQQPLCRNKCWQAGMEELELPTLLCFFSSNTLIKMSWVYILQIQIPGLHPDLPFLHEPPGLQKSLGQAGMQWAAKQTKCSLGALASKAELVWLSWLELWPLTSGVIIPVLIQRLLQMRTHGLVFLQSPWEQHGVAIRTWPDAWAGFSEDSPPFLHPHSPLPPPRFWSTTNSPKNGWERP